MGNSQDELWNTLEQIHQLVKDSKSEKSCPVSQKPHIQPTPYDGSSSWEDYHAQFDIVAELNGWETHTRAIYLAASLQGPARATLGDLDTTKRTDYEALTEALEARFGSQHHTEMYRAQLRCHVRGHEKTLPQISQTSNQSPGKSCSSIHVNQPLTKGDQPPWCRPRRGRLPGNYSGCFTCSGLDHMQHNCQNRRPMVPGKDF